MTVHSTQLATNPAVTTTEVTLYTVPAGKRTILKGYALCNNNAAANFIAIEVYSGATVLAFWREFMAAQGTDGDTITKTPWLVLNAGQTIKALCHASSISVILAGAELNL